MSSQLKSDTSRANGAKSQGPKSAETRAISAQNAVTHGFTACSAMLLKCENPEEFDSYIDHYFKTYKPADAAQEELVNEMIAARWRIRRLRVVETRLIDLEMIKNTPQVERNYAEPDPTDHLTEGFRSLIEDVRSLALVSRYESRLSRMYHRAYSILRELQRANPPAPAPPENGPARPEPPTLVPQTGATPDPAPSPEIKNDETNPPFHPAAQMIP